MKNLTWLILILGVLFILDQFFYAGRHFAAVFAFGAGLLHGLRT